MSDQLEAIMQAAERPGTDKPTKGWIVLQTGNGGWNLFESCICCGCITGRREAGRPVYGFRNFPDASVAFNRASTAFAS